MELVSDGDQPKAWFCRSRSTIKGVNMVSSNICFQPASDFWRRVNETAAGAGLIFQAILKVCCGVGKKTVASFELANFQTLFFLQPKRYSTLKTPVPDSPG